MGWRRFLRRARWDRERAEELKSYLQIETDESIARGMSAEEARQAAQRKLGNTLCIREDIYQMNTIGFLDSVAGDLRYALRGMRRHPTFTLAAVLTLALGIGANTAIFAVVHGVLIKSLSYPNAEELVSATSAEAVCERLVTCAARDFEAHWCVVSGTDGTPVKSIGTAPAPAWLHAFVEGSRYSNDVAAGSGAGGPDDVAWAPMPLVDRALVLGRSGRPFRVRERQRVT